MKVCAECRTEIETFGEPLLPERPVADYGHYILLTSLDVAGLCRTRGQCQRRGGVADGEEVVGGRFLWGR